MLNYSSSPLKSLFESGFESVWYLVRNSRYQ